MPTDWQLKKIHSFLETRIGFSSKPLQPLLITTATRKDYSLEHYQDDANKISSVALRFISGLLRVRSAADLSRWTAYYYCAYELGYLASASSSEIAAESVVAAQRRLGNHLIELSNIKNQWGDNALSIRGPKHWLRDYNRLSTQFRFAPRPVAVTKDSLIGHDLLQTLSKRHYETVKDMAIGTGHFEVDSNGNIKINIPSFKTAVWQALHPTNEASSTTFDVHLGRIDSCNAAADRPASLQSEYFLSESLGIDVSVKNLSATYDSANHQGFLDQCLTLFSKGVAEVNIAIKMGYTSDSIGSFRRRFAKHANVSLAPLTRMITEMENTSNTRQSAISGQQVSRAANDSSLNSEEAPEGQRDSVEAFVKRYKRSSSFRERILKVHGAECAVCDVRIKSLIQAAHIRPVADNGSDSDGNGIPLCPTHHDAFDQHLFTIDPDNKTVVYSQNTSAEALGINKDVINYTLNNDDVTYRYFLYLKSNDTGVHRD